MSGAGIERRRWPRIPATSLTNVTASIVAGPDVTLVNLSRGGALVEVAARYPMQSRVRIKLTGATGAITQMPGTVAWAKVASIANGKINYVLAVIFEKPIEDLAAVTGIPGVESASPGLAAEDRDLGSPTRGNVTQFPMLGGGILESPAVVDNADSTPSEIPADEVLQLTSAFVVNPVPVVAQPGGDVSRREQELDAALEETRRELALERSRREADRQRASAELAARTDEFEAALAARDRIQAAALEEQQRFEGLVAELMQAANDQQAEYQQLMAERTAALEEQIRRAERAEEALARLQGYTQQQAAFQQGCRELAAQLSAAEAAATVQESRYRTIRHEAERLVAMLASPVRADLVSGEDTDFSGETSAQAVAGG